MRLGLWGAPLVGKTTFLAALNIAVARWRGPGNWIMNGVDDKSSQFLAENTDLLVRKKRFPPATLTMSDLAFRFTGEVPLGPIQKLRQGSSIQRVAFELEVLDPPGGMYGPPGLTSYSAEEGDEDGLMTTGSGTPTDSPGSSIDRSDHERRLIEHLEFCQGIIYLFDPVRNAREGDAFTFFHRILEQLAKRVLEQENYGDSRLPQFVAVCVTKFDDPEVYRQARRYGLTVQSNERPYLPRIPDENAETFFRRLARDQSGGADLVLGNLEQHIAKNRLAFFTTSAVGHYADANGRFRPNDPANVEMIGAQAKIRGDVNPINVIEPLLWLERSIRQAGLSATNR
jgi:hypothetical protein